MKPARFEQAPDSVPPALVRPGENPALDAALARLRQKEAAGAPPHGAGPGAAAGAAAGAVAGAPRRRRPALGWWLVGLSALAIAGTMIVMALAVVGSRRQAPAETAQVRSAPGVAPAPPAPAVQVSAVAPRAATAASSSAPAASLAASARPAQAPSASAPAAPASAPPPARTMKPVDPALIE